MMTLKDLKQIKEEFEQINKSYRRCFNQQSRMELIERVKKLMTAIKRFEKGDVGAAS
jgi:hypothetical protein